MAWFGDVEAPELQPTMLQMEQLRQAKVQYGDWQTTFKPTQEKFVGAPGDVSSGLMSQDYSGYAQTRAAAESGQAANSARQKMGPVVASSGSGLGGIVDINATQGAATAAGVGQAITKGQTNIVDRKLAALQSGMGLGSNITQTTAQSAVDSASRARTVAEAELQLRTDEAAGETKLVTDMASGYAAGYKETGEANPFKWSESYGKKFGTVKGRG